MFGGIVSSVLGSASSLTQSGIPFAGDFIKGSVSNYWNDKALNRSYAFAEKYARNSPTWNVEGLRAAGLNPLLAVTKGFSGGSPSIHPQSVDTNSRLSATDLSAISLKRKESSLVDKQSALTDESIKSAKIDNKIKEDTYNTLRAENEVKRLKAEAVAGLLRPIESSPLEGDGKSVSVRLPSQSFKALQKSIADEFDLGSEKYIRTTIDSVMKYGTDVLKLLPAFRRKEIMETISKTISTDKRGRSSTSETYTIHGPQK